MGCSGSTAGSSSGSPSMACPIFVILVTHDSAPVLSQCLAALDRQGRRPDRIVIVDSGSTDRTYLQSLAGRSDVTLVFRDNIGYARANNIGIRSLPPTAAAMVVFLNPDAFLFPDALAEAALVLEQHADVAVVGGRLYGYDPAAGTATGRLDSTGIFRRWYGRWYDRGQGERDSGQYGLAESVSAICGALMACRLEALPAPTTGQVFDEDFFLYKEDIELSLRLRHNGWTLRYEPKVRAYHCRGWGGNRREVPAALRLAAARSEVLLYRKHPSPYMLWAVAKYLLVRWCRC